MKYRKWNSKTKTALDGLQNNLKKNNNLVLQKMLLDKCSIVQ